MKICDSADLINEYDIKSSEIFINFKYPEDFIEFYIKNNGGYPSDKVHIDNEGFETSVEWFFPIKYSSPVESLESVTIRFREKSFISSNEIIFAEDAGGNKFILTKDNNILYVPFDIGPDFRKKIRLLEIGFSKFVDKLITEEEAGF